MAFRYYYTEYTIQQQRSCVKHLCVCVIVEPWMKKRHDCEDLCSLSHLWQVQLLQTVLAMCILVRLQLSHSIINAVVFLFACFGATRSSLEDAFLMIQERRDVPCGAVSGWSVASHWTVSWTIIYPTPAHPICPAANNIISAQTVFLLQCKRICTEQLVSLMQCSQCLLSRSWERFTLLLYHVLAYRDTIQLNLNIFRRWNTNCWMDFCCSRLHTLAFMLCMIMNTMWSQTLPSHCCSIA